MIRELARRLREAAQTPAPQRPVRRDRLRRSRSSQDSPAWYGGGGGWDGGSCDGGGGGGGGCDG